MDKASLHEGQEYSYRENPQGWKRGVDVPVRVKLLAKAGGGRNTVRFADGSEREVSSKQLICPWSNDEISTLLREEERERAFLSETRRDEVTAGAAGVAFGMVVDDVVVGTDRAWFSAVESEQIFAAAEVTEDPFDLSPVVFRDGDDLCLPMPVVELLAKRICERCPTEVQHAVDQDVSRLRSAGHAALLSHYKPTWDRALDWAGLDPFELPSDDMAPSEGYRQLWDRLRGQGVPRVGSEDRAWSVSSRNLSEVGHLLGPAAAYNGKLTLTVLGDEFRLALDVEADARARTPEQMRDVALGLSRSQAAALGEARDAGEAGLSIGDARAALQTIESLERDGLLREDVRDLDRAESRRIHLTDAGWRVLDHLGPRAA